MQELSAQQREMLVNRCDDYQDHLACIFEYLLRKQQTLSLETFIPSCKTALNRIESVRKKGGRSRRPRIPHWDCDLSPNWKIEVDERNLCGEPGKTTFIIGWIINVEEGLITRQSTVLTISFEPEEDLFIGDTCVCKAGKGIIARRFHFDYQLFHYQTDQYGDAMPESHLQYGGKIQSESLGNDFHHGILEKLELPRIPMPPYDLSFVFDFILRQTENPLRTLVEDAEWKNIIKEGQKIWLDNYYNKCNQFISGAEKNPTFYEWLCEKATYL